MSDQDLRVFFKELNSTKNKIEMNNFIWLPSNWVLIRIIDKEGNLNSANRGIYYNVLDPVGSIMMILVSRLDLTQRYLLYIFAFLVLHCWFLFHTYRPNAHYCQQISVWNCSPIWCQSLSLLSQNQRLTGCSPVHFINSFVLILYVQVNNFKNRVETFSGLPELNQH